MKKTSSLLFIGLFLLAACFLAACSPAGPASPTPTVITASPQPTALPTPSSPGDPMTWQNLQVSMEQAEITESFLTDFGSQRVPSPGQKFLWVRVRLTNLGKSEIGLPALENFSVLYTQSEIKPIYGHRQGYTDYADLGSTLFPRQELDAWLRFDIPVTAELKDLLFVFLPTSAQVGVLPSSPGYPYAGNKPTYVWKCGR